MADNLIHFLISDQQPKQKVSLKAACGANWKRGADIRSKVTCPECLRKLTEAGK